MPFAVERIDHLVLRVRDLQASIDFYQAVLGCCVAKRRDDLGLIHLRAGASMIDLISVDGVLGSAVVARHKRMRATSIMCACV